MSFFLTRRFLPLFITQSLGAFNDNVLKNALVILITYKAGIYASIDPKILVTLAAGIFIVPFFLCSAWAGQVADKWDKSRIIKVIKASEIVIMLLACIGLYKESTGILLFSLFLMGVHSAFFGPLKYSILPDHLHEKELIAGNGAIEAGTFLAILLGTLVGGILVTIDPWGERVVALTMLVIAIAGFISSWFIPFARVASPGLVFKWNIIAETVEILSHAKKTRVIFLSVLGISWFWLVGATFLSQFPSYAKEILRAEGPVVTLFLTVFSIGIGCGSLLCNSLLKGKISAKYVPLSALAMSFFGIDLYYASHVFPTLDKGEALMGIGTFLSHGTSYRILADLLLLALASGLYIVPLYTFLQEHSDPSYRSRVIAANNVLNALFMVISAVVVSLLLLAGVEVVTIFLLVSLCNLVVAFYICGLLPDTLIKSVMKWLFVTCFRVRVTGMEHYKEAGDRVLIVANHTSFLDAALLAVFLPNKCIFAINSFIAERWWVRPFLFLVDAFPMDPTNPMATKAFIEALKKGGRAVIFPEGRITVTGSLMKIYEGPGMIADKAHASVLPVRIDGAQYSLFSRLQGLVRLQLFPKITLTIVAPQRFIVPDHLKGRARRKVIGDRLYDVMSNMLFESAHYRMPLFESLIEGMHIHGARHVLMWDLERKEINYRQLLMRSFILSTHIRKVTKARAYVGVLLPSMTGTVITFFALHAAGRVPVMLNFSAGTNAVITACQTAKLQLIYTSRRFIENARLEEMAVALEKHCQVIYLDDVRKKIGIMAKLYGLFASFFPVYAYKQHAGQVKADDPAVVLFTSGSEGVAKGVVLSHANVQANRYQLAARVDFSPQDMVFNALPLFHSFGLTAGTLLPLLSGIKTFFYPSPLHYRIIPELVYDTNATILFGTDTFLSGYARFAHPYDFYCLRYIFAGAEKLKESTRAIWTEKYGVRVFEGYGATETAPVLSVNTPMHHKSGTVGRLLPGIEHRLVTVPGIEEGGRLLVKGPNVMKGYIFHKEPGVIVSPSTELGEGWYDTGDIVTLDDECFITIKGRAKRFAKIGGEMVSLAASEEHVLGISPEKLHAVIAVSDDTKGEQLLLVTEDASITREKLTAYAKDQGIPSLYMPQKIKYVEKMPLLGSGKIDYQAVKTLLQE